MRTFIWGIGGGAAIISKWISMDDIEGFIVSDTKTNHASFMGRKVYSPADVAKMEYDAILVASVYAENIYEDCMTFGIDTKKVCFMFRYHAVGIDAYNPSVLCHFLDSERIEAIKQNSIVIQGVDIEPREGDSGEKVYRAFQHSGMYGVDYVRVRTFELIADEIDYYGIKGNVAELGCFRGAFAYYINNRFRNRRCYLFDTFQGFEKQELDSEIEAENAVKADEEVFNNTCIEMVLNHMPYPEMVEIKQGYFPESLQGLEDEFAFVSIDVDLEESIYNGIDYFYPRMVTGGYMMIHDYNSRFRGVKEAIRRFEKDKGICLHKVPLSDTAGTLVLIRE